MKRRRRSAVRAFGKAALATVVYGVVHSLLASTRAKRTAERRIGERNRAGLYRAFFNAQAVLTFAGLAAYLRRLPRHELYRIEGAPAALMRAGQLSAVVWAYLAARAVGVGPIVGWSSFREWVTGAGPRPEPEAQGPTRRGGRMHVAGPFRFSRHPLNFAPLPIFWLQPVMTSRWLGFSVASAAYLVLGSVHEERRLEQAYGAAYRKYVTGGVPFYLPGPRRSQRGRDPDRSVRNFH